VIQRIAVLAIVLLLAPIWAPAQEGPLGVIKVGAYADLLIIEGNPMSDITVLADPDNNLRVIMKDCVIYKNTL
jgi:imidazolonepropionase-like amidohydrolase